MRNRTLLHWALGVLLTAAVPAAGAQSDISKLLDLLTQKGVISQEDAVVLKKEQPPTTGSWSEKIQISGYAQTWYRQDRNAMDTFNIRRARFDLKAKPSEVLDYRLQVDFAGSPKLLDATVGYKFNPHLKITAGQFKIPFSQENLTPSSNMETVNRAQAVEALVARSTDVIGNQNGRDIGVQAGGSFLRRAQSRWVFDYAVGVFNGSGINTSDTNEQKDTVGRLVAHLSDDCTIGGSFYTGRYTLKDARKTTGGRERLGFELAYVRDPFSVKSEFISGRDGTSHKSGWYAQTAYFVFPQKLQGVFKFDTFNPDNSFGRTNVYTFGGNWYFNQWAYLQLNYELKDERFREIDDNSLIAQLTAKF